MAKKLVVLMLVLAMVLIPFVGCDQTAGGGDKVLVGVTMPTKSLQRWNEDGTNVKKALEEAGYEVDLQYADETQPTQNSMIENQITMGCKLLVIASIDGGALNDVMQQAKAKDIPVIAYDRLITNTDYCSYYATFDNYGVGKMQGEYIESALGLAEGATGPFSMECFGGDPGDNNAKLFNQGAMDVLQPYIDSGVLVVKSGQTSWPDQIAIVNWKAQGAQDRMDTLLTGFYADENIDVVLSPNDSLAQGIVASLKDAGYAVGSTDKPFPVITGQDCDKINVAQIERGEQSMSIFKDTRILADQVIVMAKAILAGETVTTNATYPNGVFDVPSFNCEIKFADKNNWKEVLIDSEYYTMEDIPLD
jgi:putative multiple sugar transport system substrate-binding protein